MRPLIHRRRDQSDPAPSRAAYRMTRLWLSPLFRRLVTAVMPAALVVGGAAAWITQPAQINMVKSWTGDILASVEARPEFQIRQMAVTGASPVLAEAIRERLSLEFPVSWFRLDPELLQASVAELDAVAQVQVSVELGGALRIAVREREPAVIWRRPFALEMLDATGHRIAYIDHRDGRPDLPLVTGTGADAAIPEALALIASAQPIQDRLRALTRRGERRWDVILDRDQVIRLPETGARQALERTLAIHAALDLLNRDVPVVDMRNPGRPTVRLGPGAMEYLRLTRTFEQGLASQ
ncbi:cell division protein FtsQ/DivIB [Fluviibacterium sp. DFM31]|uniref:Cell division protein FtsQ n=1 Tax=Meridianimarinicoccus marinus TaxID=3231483 RepID=A0ABV3L817_9RHOB